MTPFIFARHCNHTVFKLYIEKILAPELPTDMVVTIDNASFHESLKI